MHTDALSRQELIRVIEGKGCASRVPILFHTWISANTFKGEKQQAVAALLAQTPMDAQFIPLNMPDVYHAPEDEPSYRWSYRDARSDLTNTAHDSAGVILDWDEELDSLLNDFPDPQSPHLFTSCPPDDGRYRIGMWWYFFFERFWSIRSMDEALMDFYLNPDAVHQFFQKLTDFYIQAITRAKETLNLDAIFTSDDLGTQTSTFFSTEIFDTFFYPYYKQVIDHIHALGMHFWLHTCGNIEALIPRFIELGVDVLHPIQKHTMDEQKIAQKYGGDLCIWAGFDVQQTIPYGTAEDVRKEVRFLIDAYRRKDGRFMMTLGNGATPDTPIDSLIALFDESLRYGANV